jgi:dUTP pyrophosphatase
MLTNYDLIDLGFEPKYSGFDLIKKAVNLKISNKNITLENVYREIDFYHPASVEKNIRTCLRNSNSKYKNCIVSKAINAIAKEFENTEDNVTYPKVKFQKVSFKQWCKDMKECGFKFTNTELQQLYDDIKLPKRATEGSAGYDFFAPFDLKFELGKDFKFPTGIKCLMDGNVVLMLFPRSGLGFKYGLQLLNTCGVIDSDYMLAKNEGHIHCKMHYFNKKVECVNVEKGNGYMQGILMPFYKTVDDNTEGKRTGGLGSTTIKKENKVA